MSSQGGRRAEILDTAAALFASSGLRVSLQEIADACGILPGSLYHHFDSKEAIVVELVRRYRDALAALSAEALEDGESDRGPVEERIVDFGRAIAARAVEHRAAVLLTLYEPPSVLGGELADLAREAPRAIERAMLALLERARGSGVVRPGVDLALLGDRLCQSMLHVGVGVSHVTPGAERVPELRLRILLHGIATRTPTDGDLDASAPIKSVEKVVAAWDEDTGDDDERTAHLQAVARREFGRRGFEATTMRDIAAAAGLSTGTVYRSFASKDELLLSVMRAYSDKVRSAWTAALEPEGSPLERLDAIMCANIHLLDRFSDEFRIQLAWLRQSPPSTPNLGGWFTWHLRHVKALLADGARAGELHVQGAPADIRARCVYEAIVVPPGVIAVAGVRGAHSLARDTVLRGALVGPKPGPGAD